MAEISTHNLPDAAEPLTGSETVVGNQSGSTVKIPLTIISKDSLRQSVEAASGGKQTVLYTEKGHPSYMYVLPAFNKEDFNAGLGTGLHEAFILGGSPRSEVFIGVYQGKVVDGELVSIPGVDPEASRNFDSFVSAARACGPGWHVITNAEWSALALWAWKNGFQPRGNNNWGRDYANKWETGRRPDGNAPGVSSGTGRTLTGSGPVSWNHDGTASGVADLNGNINEWVGGLRLNNGEIQIIPNNDAALNATDMSASSPEWRAILASDGSLVAPGTAGTLKYDAASMSSGSNVVLSDILENQQGSPDDNTNGDNAQGSFGLLSEGNGITAPEIAKALGLFPVANDFGSQRLYARNYGERLPYRGGNRANTSYAGLFCLYLGYPRSNSITSVGSRPAFVI